MPDTDVIRPEFFPVEKLGECTIKSPLYDSDMIHFHEDTEGVLRHREYTKLAQGARETHGAVLSFERAGARRMLFHDPRYSKAAILTAGGLCPGLNNVIKALTLTLCRTYGVPKVYGVPYGFAGLVKDNGFNLIDLDLDVVDSIHEKGGTILGSSRGRQDPAKMLELLMYKDINMVFCIGGDGTLRSAAALAEEIKKQKQNISVVCVPKTIDNDINCMDRTFGFETAVYATTDVVTAAHNEANGAYNGIGLIHVMGRDSGFIAAHATLANTHVNYCLIPEEKFFLEEGPNALLPNLMERLQRRHHAVIMVAEGAGQDLIPGERAKDKSGNELHKDIGLFLKDKIAEYAKAHNIETTIKYLDPTYQIRACAAHGTDAVFCLMLAQNAVHAAMTGRTNMVVGHWSGTFTHVPIAMAVEKRKKIDPSGSLWQAVRLRTWH